MRRRSTPPSGRSRQSRAGCLSPARAASLRGFSSERAECVARSPVAGQHPVRPSTAVYEQVVEVHPRAHQVVEWLDRREPSVGADITALPYIEREDVVEAVHHQARGGLALDHAAVHVELALDPDGLAWRRHRDTRELAQAQVGCVLGAEDLEPVAAEVVDERAQWEL